MDAWKQLTGIKECVALLDGIAIDRSRTTGDVRRTSARKLVRRALHTKRSAEEQRGFERAMTEYLAIIAEGCVPTPDQLEKELRAKVRGS